MEHQKLQCLKFQEITIIIKPKKLASSPHPIILIWDTVLYFYIWLHWVLVVACVSGYFVLLVVACELLVAACELSYATRYRTWAPCTGSLSHWSTRESQDTLCSVLPPSAQWLQPLPYTWGLPAITSLVTYLRVLVPGSAPAGTQPKARPRDSLPVSHALFSFI